MINFIFEPAISLALFYLAYRLLLRNMAFFNGNRIFMLSAAAFSLVLPLLNIHTPVTITNYSFLIPEVTVTGDLPEATHVARLSLTRLLMIIYIAGILFFGGRFLIRLLQLFFLAAGNISGEYKNARIVSIKSHHSPFSFFNYIFINETLYGEEEKRRIMEHELVHIRQLHSLDLILLELLITIQWFNPAAWLFRRSLLEIHEYLADEEIIRQGTNIPLYQSLLLNLQLGTGFLSPASNFNKSLTLNRIKMMTTIKPPAWKKTRFFILLPLVLLILMCTKTEVMISSDDDITRTVPAIAERGEDGILRSVPTESSQNAEVFFIVEDMPDFQGGGPDAFRRYISTNLRYPQIAAGNGIQGRVFVQFVVKDDGSVADATIVRGVEPSLDREALRVVMSSPRWTPGRQRGQAVNVAFTFPISFVLETDNDE